MYGAWRPNAIEIRTRHFVLNSEAAQLQFKYRNSKASQRASSPNETNGFLYLVTLKMLSETDIGNNVPQ